MKYGNTTSSGLRQYSVANKNIKGEQIFENFKTQFKGKFKLINSSEVSSTIEIKTQSAHFRVQFYSESQATGKPTIKISRRLPEENGNFVKLIDLKDNYGYH